MNEHDTKNTCFCKELHKYTLHMDMNKIMTTHIMQLCTLYLYVSLHMCVCVYLDRNYSRRYSFSHEKSQVPDKKSQEYVTAVT